MLSGQPIKLLIDKTEYLVLKSYRRDRRSGEIVTKIQRFNTKPRINADGSRRENLYAAADAR